MNNKILSGVVLVISLLSIVWIHFKQALLFGDFLLSASVMIAGIFAIFYLAKTAASKIPSWTALIPIIPIFLIRFFVTDIAYPETELISITRFIAIVLLLSTSLAIMVFSKTTLATKPAEKEQAIFSWKAFSALLIILVMAITLTSMNLDNKNFQNDEYYQLEAAKGYIETGEFVQWNFVTNEPQATKEGGSLMYSRAWPYTWQVAQSFRIFGISEVSGRLPSVIWFTLFAVLAFTILWAWKRDTLFALLTTITIIGLDHFVLHGRLLRMYGMFLFWSGLAMLFWYLAYKHTTDKKKFKSGLLFLLSAILTSGFALMIHNIFVVFFAGLAVFLVLRFMVLLWPHYKGSVFKWSVFKSNHELAVSAIWAIIAMSAFAGLLIASFIPALQDFIRLDLIGVRKSPNFEYEFLPFSDLPLPFLGLTLYLYGLWVFIKKNAAHQFMALTSITVILVFVLFLKRYHTFRYILFMVPIIITISSAVFYGLLTRATYFIKEHRLIRAGLIAAIFLAVYAPISFPGISEGAFFAAARADKVHENGFGHDFETAYKYIQENMEPHEVIYTQSFRSYYWGADDVAIFDLGKDESMSRTQLLELMEQNGTGWFVWADGKSHHLRKRVKKYIKKHATDIVAQTPELQNSNMQIYYFNPVD